jgi:hypothetical protein
MRIKVLAFAASLLLISNSSARIPQTPATTTSAPQRDPQAVAILQQSLNVAGGISTIGLVTDYTASGAITYHRAGQDVAGNVTIRGRGLDQFRIDASMPAGVNSWVASHGKAFEKAEDGTVSQVLGLSFISPSSLILPYIQLVQALKDRTFSIEFRGPTTIDGNSAYDIQVRRGFALPDGTIRTTEIGALDVFIDAASSHIIMTRDEARPPRNSAEGPPHEMRFADYRSINNLLVPFAVSESIGGQGTWQIQLNNFSFNSGLTDSSFAF